MAGFVASCLAPWQYPCSACMQLSSRPLPIAGCPLTFGKNCGHSPASLTAGKRVPGWAGRNGPRIVRIAARNSESCKAKPEEASCSTGGDDTTACTLEEAQEIALADVLGLTYRALYGPATGQRPRSPPALLQAFLLLADDNHCGLVSAVVVLTCDGSHGKRPQVDRKKLAMLLGVRAIDLTPATPDQLAAMGLEPCASQPVQDGARQPAPPLLLSQLLSVHAKVVVDPAACAHGSLAFRAGKNTGHSGQDRSLEVAVGDIVRVTGAVVADVVMGKLTKEMRPFLSHSAWRAGRLAVVPKVATSMDEVGDAGSVPGSEAVVVGRSASAAGQDTVLSLADVPPRLGTSLPVETPRDGAASVGLVAAGTHAEDPNGTGTPLAPRRSPPYDHARKLLAMSQAVDWCHVARLYAAVRVGEDAVPHEGGGAWQSPAVASTQDRGHDLLPYCARTPQDGHVLARQAVQGRDGHEQEGGTRAGSPSGDGGNQAAVADAHAAPRVHTEGFSKGLGPPQTSGGGGGGSGGGGGGNGSEPPLLDIVGVIASRRRIGRLLTFLTLLVPPSRDVLVAAGAASSAASSGGAPLSRASLPYASPCGCGEGDDTSTQGAPQGYVQVIVGKTLVAAIGEAATYETLKRLRVGGVVWVRGRWKPHVAPPGAAASSGGDGAGSDLITANLVLLASLASASPAINGASVAMGGADKAASIAGKEGGAEEAPHVAEGGPLEPPTQGGSDAASPGAPPAAHLQMPRGCRLVPVTCSDSLAEMARCVLPLVGYCDLCGDAEALARLGWSAHAAEESIEGCAEGCVDGWVVGWDGAPQQQASMPGPLPLVPTPPFGGPGQDGGLPDAARAWLRQPPTSAPARVAVLGLDCEWQPRDLSGKGQHAPVALLQLATPDEVFVVDMLWWFGGVNACEGAPMSMRSDASPPGSSELSLLHARVGGAHAMGRLLSAVLRSPHAIKLGFDFSYDLKRLCLSYPAFAHYFDRACMLVSVRHLVASCQDYLPPPPPPVVNPDADGMADASLWPPHSAFGRPRALSGWSGIRQWGLSRVCHAVLGVPLDKTHQASDWGARPLSPAQLRYAATDAWSLLCIYSKVCTAFWKKHDALMASDRPESGVPSDYQVVTAGPAWHLPACDLSDWWEILPPRK